MCIRDRWSQCAEVTYVKSVTGPDGRGTAQFPIWRGVPLPQMPVVGTRNFSIPCNNAFPCDVVVSECGFDIDSDRAARARITFTPGGVNPSVTTEPPLSTTTTSRPEAPPLDTEPVTAAYSNALHLFLDEMRFRALAEPVRVNVDLLTQNSPNALEQFVNQAVDFTISALGLDDEQLAALKAARRDVAYVPIAVSALTVVQRLRVNGIESDQAAFSADSLSRIYHAPSAGDSWTQIASWSDPALVADNGGCDVQIDGRRYPVGSFRGDASAANFFFTRWLAANAPSWELGSSQIMPINDSQTYGRPSTEELAKFVAFGDPAIDHATNSSAGRIGFIDRSYARAFGLTEAALKNGAGEYVHPTDEAILKALEADYDASRFFAPNVTSTTPGAYPLPIVYYAIVQTNLTDSFTQAKADATKEFLEFLISDQSQQRASELGLVRLPAPLKEQATQAIAKIGTTDGSGGEAPPPFGSNEESSSFFDDLGFGDSDFSWDYDSGDFGDTMIADQDPGTDAGSLDDGDDPNGQQGEDAGTGHSPIPIKAVLPPARPTVALPALLGIGAVSVVAGHLMKRQLGVVKR
ncbi:MAG: substrate-binding domain-containing protein, partial [Acidimicrobiales bacterium]|nr:substrate-binding domain-containing protein [Acidimicrobiales bacterium]